MQNCLELDIISQSFDIWLCILKTTLGQFGPKALGKGLIKPLVKNRSSNIHKQDFIFFRIMRWIEWNY